MKYIRRFDEVGIQDVPLVGGKNASLGEMYQNLSAQGIKVPDGYIVTADAYWEVLSFNNIRQQLEDTLAGLNTTDFSNLAETGAEARRLILKGQLPPELKKEILDGYARLMDEYGSGLSLAVRSSATAEDLPRASFAGQQESYLNIRGEEQLLQACLRCFASLFTDRAIKYRHDNGFEHMKVALSIGIQLMVRADKGCAGVVFTIDPDTGFDRVVVISGAWGLGENVVQGTVNTDEFIIFKPLLGKVAQPVITHRLGSKALTMILAEDAGEGAKTDRPVANIETPQEMQGRYILEDHEVVRLAQWAVIIEQYYGMPMDIEFARDGISGQMYIVQARPETVHAAASRNTITMYEITSEHARPICTGIGLGNRIITGIARVLSAPAEIDKLQPGEILVTARTNPDWDPVMKKVAGIITDQGGRTSHAAIVARELGLPAVIGAGNATGSIRNGQEITVSCVEGEKGFVYDGKVEWKENIIELDADLSTRTQPLLILAHPELAFRHSFLPSQGVGLLRIEFIICDSIGIHPMALAHFEQLQDAEVKKAIAERTRLFPDKKEFFIQKLAEAVALIGASFYPRKVIVRMSDFKTNEYAGLLGGKQFEPAEENPMIGFRGASRYYHPLYADGFRLECEAMRIVRDEMGLNNVRLMIPFCRTVDEARKVVAIMEECRLKRGENELEIYMMVEIPSNVVLAEKFAEVFDGFSIGSNDLTQLVLGADRDSELLADIFTPFDEAVMEMIRTTIQIARARGTNVGLCGQAPSDFPKYAALLVEWGIDSISFNPDALMRGIENIRLAEQLQEIKKLP